LNKESKATASETKAEKKPKPVLQIMERDDDDKTNAIRRLDRKFKNGEIKTRDKSKEKMKNK